MIDPNVAPPPPAPRPPWFVRMLGPRPAESFGAQFAEVVRRTAWLLPCEVILMQLVSLTGLQAGNAGQQEIEDLMSGGALRFLAIGAILSPAIEEAVFRGLPSLLSDMLLRRTHGQRWWLGILGALCFAAAHNLTGEAGPHTILLTTDWYFDTSMVPAAQFVFGLLAWDLMRRYGLWAAAFSHMLHNLVFLSLALLPGSST